LVVATEAEPRAGGVELKLSDRNSHAVGAEVAEAEDAPGVGHADDAHVLERPVAQHLLHMTAPRDRQVHAPRAPEDVAKLQAHFADRRVIDNRKEPRGVRHDRSVEERLVVIKEVDEIDISVEIGCLVPELLHDPAKLKVLRFRRVRHQSHKAQRLSLVLGEGGGFIERRIVEKIYAALGHARACHNVLLPMLHP
jgi:hypothetical protein